MQILENVFRIEDVEEDGILEVIADKYCRTILYATTSQAKSVMEIAIDAQIPISTAYRKIQLLDKHNMLFTSGKINEDGKKMFLYKSKIKGMQCNFNGHQMEVKLILNK